MSCLNPNYALDLGVCDGKRKLKFLPKRADFSSIHQLEARYGKEHILTLPCGKCTSCLLNYARTWAVRCSLEASLFDNNWFATFTYSPENYVDDAKKCRKDIQMFIKLLRYYYPGTRYFGCLERGSKTNRLHFHLILFNCNLTDAQPIGKGQHGGYYYKSPSLERIWSKGIVDLGDCSFKSCSYVARYCLKKRLSQEKSDEFIFMSTKPAIGLGWLKRNFHTVIEYDKIFFNFGNFGKAPVPRYFDKYIEKVDPNALEQVKAQRISKANLSSFSDLIRYGLIYREELYSQEADQIEKKVKLLKRGF